MLCGNYILSNRSEWTFYFLSSVQFNFTIGEAFKNQKISNEDFISWIKSFDFNPYAPDLIEFYRFNNVKSLLENIYVKLNSLSLLNVRIKDYIEEYFSKKD